jgi:hypothetical protein
VHGLETASDEMVDITNCVSNEKSSDSSDLGSTSSDSESSSSSDNEETSSPCESESEQEFYIHFLTILWLTRITFRI